MSQAPLKPVETDDECIARVVSDHFVENASPADVSGLIRLYRSESDSLAAARKAQDTRIFECVSSTGSSYMRQSMYPMRSRDLSPDEAGRACAACPSPYCKSFESCVKTACDYVGRKNGGA